MLFPLIKIKTPQGERIVGTNNHDQLNVEDGKSIFYYNLQNGISSKFGDYEFAGENDPYMGVTVEFVTFETLQEIYKEQCEADVIRAEKKKQVFQNLWLHDFSNEPDEDI